MTSDYVFYYGGDDATVSRIKRAARSHWGEVTEIQVDKFRLFVSAAQYASSFCQSSDPVGAISGYVRSSNLEHLSGEGSSLGRAHNQLFTSHIIKRNSWPLGEEWTGSFSAVAYSKSDLEVVICNDPIGYIPIYYAFDNGAIIGGTSLIVLSKCLDCEADVVGILQRITSPYCNYGRRTLLKRVFRLLPGECLRFSGKDSGVESLFDNSLCNGVLDGDINSIARRVWDCLQREITLAVGSVDRTSVGMSGGWDCRLILGGIAHRGNTIDCYTYGSGELYETKIAQRCAKAVGAQHRWFSVEDKYFPPRADLEGHIKKTEAANFMQWFTIIDSLKERAWADEPVLLGDLCDSMDGRNITTQSSRKARKKSFVNQLMGKADHIPIATTDSFNEWKETKQSQIIKDLLGNVVHLSPDLVKGINEELLVQELQSDLELGFSRVHDNLPAFALMFDELFAWFHRARYLMASQNLQLSSIFRPISPAISLRFLRLTSTIHPRLRLRRKLLDAIARLPEFDTLAEIPSASIPWLSVRSSTFARELIWGIRSGLDQVMMRRVMRSKDPSKKQRVLRSLDYIKEYRRENVDATVRDWFSGKWVKPDKYVETLKRRGNLSAWPLVNLDIAVPANVSITLDLCDPKSKPVHNSQN